MKDVAVTQLAQHPGMFPQGYLLPNGHTTTDFVQAQAAAAAAAQVNTNYFSDSLYLLNSQFYYGVIL